MTALCTTTKISAELSSWQTVAVEAILVPDDFFTLLSTYEDTHGQI